MTGEFSHFRLELEQVSDVFSRSVVPGRMPHGALRSFTEDLPGRWPMGEFKARGWKHRGDWWQCDTVPRLPWFFPTKPTNLAKKTYRSTVQEGIFLLSKKGRAPSFLACFTSAAKRCDADRLPRQLRSSSFLKTCFDVSQQKHMGFLG